MKLLGITGGIGAGKSLVTRCFKELGATIVDADAIARQILDTNGIAYEEVIRQFGCGILEENKNINRKKLAQIVFSDSKKLEQLNQITHPCVFKEMEHQINDSKTPLVCLDVPLLFSSNFPFSCDKTLAVIAPKELRIQRVIERDGTTRSEVEARIAAQLSEEEFKKFADYCICNDGEEEKLREEIQRVYNDIMELKS